MAKAFGSKQTDSEIISNILNYQKFLKKWDDPEIAKFQHIEKIPYMKMVEDENKEEKVALIDGFENSNKGKAEKDI